MDFEWDEEKNKENIRKHNLDFRDSPEIFGLPMLTRIDERVVYGETRFVGTGLLKNSVVVLVFVERKNDIIRIISLRKALKHEREKFEKQLRYGLGLPENGD